MKTNRNPIAKYCGRINKAKMIPARKGKGSYRRIKRVEI
jgi:stalled ribosome alternative rescue factor ArfA